MSSALYAESDTTKHWTTSGNVSLLMNQTSYTNWSRGGETSIAGTSYLNYNFNYKNGDLEWNNTINFAYGMMNSEEFSYVKKTEDRIDFQSKLGHKVKKNLSAALLLNFKSQFDDGFKYPNDTTIISTFLAPGYLILSAGLDYKPIEGLSIFFTPLSGKMIFCFDTLLADQGKYIPEPAEYDDEGNKIKDGASMIFNFGATMNIEYKKELFKNIDLHSKMSLFQNYTDKNADNRWNIDVDFEATVNLKVNDYISSKIFVHLLYDHDTKIPLFDDIDGKEIQVGTGPRLQIKQILGIGFSYKF